jgi:hypothetical protein
MALRIGRKKRQIKSSSCNIDPKERRYNNV